MEERSDPFEPYIIKKYRYWTLYLNKDQRYLGRAYAWLLRAEKMIDYFDLHPQEENELFRINFRYRRAIDQLWKPDKWNYAWLGNEIEIHGGHGHMHFIPRYREIRYIGSRPFYDGRWGKNYAPYSPYNIPEDDLMRIRNRIKRYV